jgi:hypothetical protein
LDAPGGAPRRNVTGDQGDGHQRQRHAAEGQRIGGADGEEQIGFEE